MDLRFSSLAGMGAGEVKELCGVDSAPSAPEVVCAGDVGEDEVAAIEARRSFFSSSCLSRAPRSTSPSSSSIRPRSGVSHCFENRRRESRRERT